MLLMLFDLNSDQICFAYISRYKSISSLQLHPYYTLINLDKAASKLSQYLKKC